MKLFLTMLMSMVGSVVFAYDIAVKNDDNVTLYYNYINDGKELELTYNKDDKYSGVVAIPESVTYMNRTRKVTCVGERAFFWSSKLTSVSIPSTITVLKEYAFMVSGIEKIIIKDISAWCKVKFKSGGDNGNGPFDGGARLYDDENKEITHLVIPNDVDTIEAHVFSNCRSLKKVSIPEGVKTIENHAFSECVNLETITIPTSVTAIGMQTFYHCSALKSLEIPDGIEGIEYGLMTNCENLETIVIGKDVKLISSTAFEGCKNLKKVIIRRLDTWCGIKCYSNPLSIAKHLYIYPNSEIINLVIPDGVEKISENAFSYCVNLRSVRFPPSLKSIEGAAFKDCNKIETVTSQIETPFAINGLTTNNSTFHKDVFYNATLYVPTGTMDYYKKENGWKDFSWVEERGNETNIYTAIQSFSPFSSFYSITGSQINKQRHGLYIIKMNDGTIRKKIVK